MKTEKTNPGNPLIVVNPGSDMKHSDLTHKIIGCAMEVHGILGNGFQEVIYQRALAIELYITPYFVIDGQAIEKVNSFS